MAYWQGLQVRMLGNFSLSFEGQALHLNMKQNSKPLQLLQMLLDAREDGVPRRGVIDALFGQETETDAANSLNVTVFRLRKLLQESALPHDNYIRVRTDRYFFEAPFPIWIDTEEVIRLRQAADLATGSDKMSILYQLCDLYDGRFLPDLDGEDWAEVARAHYQRIFHTSVEELCHTLEARHAYTELLRLSEFASTLFPFDEWQVWQQESLLALGRVREAQELYRSVEKLYMRELDAPPPERMLAHFRPDRAPWRKAETASAIWMRLTAETPQDGPAYLPLPSFLNAYRLLGRAGGKPPVCLLCTLVGSAPDSTQFHWTMEHLETALLRVLTPTDAFTRYSRSQFLAILVDRDPPDINDIAREFAALADATRLRLECHLLSGGSLPGKK